MHTGIIEAMIKSEVEKILEKMTLLEARIKNVESAMQLMMPNLSRVQPLEQRESENEA